MIRYLEDANIDMVRYFPYYHLMANGSFERQLMAVMRRYGLGLMDAVGLLQHRQDVDGSDIDYLCSLPHREIPVLLYGRSLHRPHRWRWWIEKFETQTWVVYHHDSPGVRVTVKRSWFQRLIYPKDFSGISETHLQGTHA